MYFFGLFSLRHSVLNLNFIWGKSYWEDLHLEDQDNLHMHLKETTPPPPLCCLTHASLGEIAVSEKKKLLLSVTTIPTEKEWERKYLAMDQAFHPLPCAAFARSQLSPVGLWEMLNFN